MQKPSILSSSSLKRLLANSGWSVLGAGMGRILNLLAMIFVARNLGLIDFGYFAFIQSTIATLGIFAGASLGVTAIRFVSLYLTTDPDKAGRIVGLVLVTASALTLVMSAIAFTMAPIIARSLTDAPPQALVASLSVAALALLLMSMRGVQDALLSGLGTYREAAILKLVEGIAVLLCVPWLAANLGLFGAVAGMAFAMALPAVLGFWRVTHHLRRHGICVTMHGMRAELPILLGFSLPAFISGTLSIPTTWIALYILSQQPNGIGEIALFNAAYQWYGPLIFLPMMMNSAGIPILVQLWTADKHEEFRRMMYLLLAAGALIPGLPAIGIILARDQIMASYGAAFLPGTPALVILALVAPLTAMARLCGTALESMNRAWLVFRGSGVWAVAFLLAATYLAPTYGATGLAVGFCIGAAAQFVFMFVTLFIAIYKK